jgi:hypothetical protein
MADNITDKPTLKGWFVTGAKPTEDEFAKWMDSYWHKSETMDISNVTNLEKVLNEKAGAATVSYLSSEITSLSSTVAGKQDCSPKNNVEYVLYNGGLSPLEYTTYSSYSDLQTLKSTGSLTPGMWYSFDFRSIYVQPVTGTVMGLQGQINKLSADVSSLRYKMLIQATGTNTFSKDVKVISVYDETNGTIHDYSKYCHLWTVEYMFDNDTDRCAWIDATQSMGAITRLIDHKGNESYYDHLNIRFRVYAIDTTNITVYSSTATYTAYSSLVWMDSNKNTIAYLTDKKQLMPIAYIDTSDTNSKYQSFSSSNIAKFISPKNLFIPVLPGDYIDRVTFDSNCYNNYLSKINFTGLYPNIFTRAVNIMLPGDSENNLFIECSDIHFTLPDNDGNVLANTTQCVFDYNADTNTIINCNEISAQQDFNNHNISYSYRLNYLHNCNNTQIYQCSNIEFKNETDDIFAYYCDEITFENNCNNIILNESCSQVIFESSCNNITLPKNTYNLTVRAAVHDIDLSLSTQLNSDKSKELIFDESSVCRLLYYGSNGVAQLTSPTA